MKITIKRIFCLFLASLLIIPSLCGSTAFAEDEPEIVDGGYCGLGIISDPDSPAPYEIANNLSWTLDSDGVLTISGYGEMMHFYDGEQEYYCAVPWNKDAIKKVIVEEGVKSIGMGAFYNCPQLTTVELPAGLESIYQNAFNGSKNLVSIALPDSVDMGGIGICLGSPEHITIFRGLYNRAGDWMSGPLSGGDFYYGSHVVSVTIEEGARFVPKRAFSSQRDLKTLILPQSVSYIGIGAFAGCKALKTIYYTGTEEQWDQFRNDICDYNYGDHSFIDEYIIEDSELYTLYNADVHFVEYQDGHYLENVPATEATETEHGYTAGVYCVDTDTWLSGHEVIHNTFGEVTVLSYPTEDEEGEAIITCTVCGESGLYALECPPPAEQPEDEEEVDAETLNAIRRVMQSIISFILRLVKWLGNIL